MWRKAMVIGIGLLLLAGLGACWYLKSQSFMEMAAAALTEEATKVLNTQVKIEKIRLQSLREIVADNIVVYDKSGAAIVAAEQITVQFSPWRMLDERALVQGIGQITVAKPVVCLQQRLNGQWNYQDLWQTDAQGSNDFVGKVVLQDATVTIERENRKFEMQKLQGTLDFAAQPEISFVAEFLHETGSAEVSGTWGGKTPAISVKAKNFALENYLDFLPENMAIKLNQGMLRSLDITVRQPAGEYVVNGEAIVVGASLDIEGTTIEQIDGLVLFNEKNLRIFSRGKVNEQPIVLRGTTSLDVIEPVLDLNVSSQGFDVQQVLCDFPVSGKVAFNVNVHGKYSAPIFEGTVNMPQAQLADYQIQNVKAKLYFANSLLTVEDIRADLSGGKISGSGQVAVNKENYYFKLQAQAVAIADFAAQYELAGNLQADVIIAGDNLNIADAQIYGNAALEHGQYKNIAITRLNTNFYKAADYLTIDALSVILPQGEIGVTGEIFGDKLDLAVHGEQIDLAVVRQLQAKLSISGLADFTSKIGGTIAMPDIAATLTATAGEVFAQPYQRAEGTVRTVANALIVEDFVLRNNLTQHRLSGSIGLIADHPLNLRLVSTKARAEDIMKIALPGEKLTGNVDNKVLITGSLDQIDAVGEMNFSEGSFRDLFLTKATGQYQWQDGQLTLSDFMVSSPNLKVLLNGKLTAKQELDFSIVADDVNFGKFRLNLPYPVSGVGKFSGKLAGTLTCPQFDGKLTAPELLFNKQKLTAVNGQIVFKDQVLELKSFGFKQGNGDFNLTTGMNIATEQLFGYFSVQQGSLAAILALFDLDNQWIDGAMDGTVTLGGTLEQPRVRLKGAMAQGKLKDYPLSNIEMDIDLAGKLITIKEFKAKQGTGSLVAQGSLDLAGPINLEFSGQDIDAGLITSLADAKLEAQGTLSFGAQVSGTVNDPRANLSLDINGGGVSNATFDTLFGMFTLQDGIIRVEQILAQKGNYKASAYGVVPLKALTEQETAGIKDQMNLKISLDQADLSILPFLTKEIDWAMGETEGGITVSGTIEQPQFYGKITVKDGAMKFAALGKPLQNLELEIGLLGDRLEVQKFQGNMGNGNYQMTGNARLTGLKFTDYQFTLDLNKLEIVNPYYTGPLEGQLILTEAKSEQVTMPQLTGNLYLENSTLDIPPMPTSEAAMPLLKLDLAIDLGKKVRLYNPFIYDIWLEGHAKFAGNTQQPQASGEISAIRGTVSYLKTPFKIREASAYFNQVDSLLPSLRLEADTRLQRTKIYLRVAGPANAMQLKLTSDPAMNESEILSLLTLRSRYNDRASGGYSGMGRDELVALLDIGLQMSFLTEVEDMLRNTLGVDELRVVRDTLSGTGHTKDEEVYNVEIGKYIDDKLLLRYTTGIDHGSYKFGISYEFNSKISLATDLDQDNKSTIGLEARFKF